MVLSTTAYGIIVTSFFVLPVDYELNFGGLSSQVVCRPAERVCGSSLKSGVQ
jgi:hypothetical protein